jgi:hypothetical protein
MAREPWLLDSIRFCSGAAVAVSSSSSAIPLLTLLPRGDDGGDDDEENEGLGDTARRVLDRNLSRLWPRRRNPPTITGSCYGGENLARAPAHGGAPMPTRRSRIVEALCERGSWTRHACMGLLRGARSADDGSPVVRAREAGDWPALPAASTTTAAAAVARGRGGPGIFALLRALCARAWPASARRPQARARTIGLDASAANSRWGDGVVMLGSKPKLENQWQAGTRHC